MTHHPKGSMCMYCGNYDRDKCANLPFDTMPVIDRYHNGQQLILVVKCVEYKRESAS